MIIPQEIQTLKTLNFDENKSRSHLLVSELDSEEMVAKEIAKHLREPKSEFS